MFDTDDVNAFVMPGQQVGVYRGITELTENDDQLASILGHEAGHIDGRHSAARGVGPNDGTSRHGCWAGRDRTVG